MDRIINVIALLTLISCSRWQTISDQNIIKQEQEKLIRPVQLEIRPGELLKVDFRVGQKKLLLKCKGKEVPYYISRGTGIAFLVESYFTEFKPYTCSLGKAKIFDVKVVKQEFPSERLHVDKRKVFYSK